MLSSRNIVSKMSGLALSLPSGENRCSVKRSGEEKTVEACFGLSVMEAIRDNGFDELLALCGSCCSCATCQVHVDAAFRGKLPPMGEDENDLLDSSDHRNETSRLSSQLPVSVALDGLKVTIAEED